MEDRRRLCLADKSLTLHLFAKVGVEGSNPFARSKLPNKNRGLEGPVKRPAHRTAARGNAGVTSGGSLGLC